MNAKEEKLRRLFKTDHRYLVPLWQRQYSWGLQQWKSLWEDLEQLSEIADSRTGVASHFFGAVILSDTKTEKKHVNDPNDVIVIDGQQRITTAMIVLAAIRDVMGPDGDIDFSGYLVNPETKTGQRYKLIPQADDQEMFFKILDGSGVDEPNLSGVAEVDLHSEMAEDEEASIDPYFQLLQEKAETDQISRAYIFFRKKLEARKDNEESLEPLVQALENLDVVTITLHSQDSWQKIFETVNALGVDLIDSDLIRNYLFMRIKQEHQVREYDQSWKPMEQRLSNRFTDFLLSYAISKGEKASAQKKSIYKVFRYQLAKPDGSEADVLELIEDLASESELFLRVLRGKGRDCWDRDSESRLEFLAQWGAVPMHPLLLKLLREIGNDERELGLCLKMLQSFVVRRFLAGTPPNDLRARFTKIAINLRDASPSNIAARLLDELKMETARWASDEKILKSLKTEALYTPARSNWAFLTLKALAPGFEASWKATPWDIVQGTLQGCYQVEHILPQSATNWRNDLEGWGVSDLDAFIAERKDTLPNLTLTKYNPDMSNKSFAEKKVWLAKENIEMSRTLAEFKVWAGEQMDDRSKDLFEKIQNIFPGPTYDWLVQR